MKIDILAIVAHPDDVELSFGGTLLVHQKRGCKTGIIDLTRGELGTRGTPEIRTQEASRATKILALSIRDNIGLEDGFFENNKKNQLKIVEQLRKYSPSIVITNATYDRHPDHARSAQLVETACFLAGLAEVKTSLNGAEQKAIRPEKLYFSIQSTSHEPDVLVDISGVMKERKEAIMVFKSQFFDSNSKAPETYISSKGFMEMLDARSREFGHRIGVDHAEGFKVKHAIGVKNLFDLI